LVSNKLNMELTYIYLFHGRVGSPNGTVKKLQETLEPSLSGVQFTRPLLPHNNPDANPEESLKYIKSLNIPKNSLLIGVSLGGLVAAKLQEKYRPDLHVICISSPTVYKDFKLESKANNRISFYSSNDDIISERVSNWPELGESYDLTWLTHNTDLYLPEIHKLVLGYINKSDLKTLVKNL
jgi:predicted esterase YcpF (UPF0227 family)